MSSTPPAEPDATAVAAMWSAYRAASGTTEEPADVFCFGDSAALADELADLVLAGVKRATAGASADYEQAGWAPSVGARSVACRGDGTPVCVIATIEVRSGRLDSVDAAFAWDEGEGDRTRDTWLAEHRAYFTRTFAAAGRDLPASGVDALPVVFERFEVVWPADPAAATLDG